MAFSLSEYPVPLIGSIIPLQCMVSFETNEVGTFSFPLMPFRFKLNRVDSVVTKTVAGSNDGTITLKKASTTYAEVTVAASAAIGDEDADTTVTETAFELTEQLKVVTAKSTAGGRCLLTVFVEVLPTHQ